MTSFHIPSSNQMTLVSLLMEFGPVAYTVVWILKCYSHRSNKYLVVFDLFFLYNFWSVIILLFPIRTSLMSLATTSWYFQWLNRFEIARACFCPQNDALCFYLASSSTFLITKIVKCRVIKKSLTILLWIRCVRRHLHFPTSLEDQLGLANAFKACLIILDPLLRSKLCLEDFSKSL